MIGRGVLVLVASVTTASASPIEPTWSVPFLHSCADTVMLEWGSDIALFNQGVVERRARKTGEVLQVLKLPSLGGTGNASVGWTDGDRLELVLGDLFVIHGGHYFAAVDSASVKLLWRRDQEKGDGGLPFLVGAGSDVVWIHPASGSKRPTPSIELIDGKTGKTKWRIDSPTNGKPKDWRQIGWAVTDGKTLFVSTSPGLSGPTHVLSAIALSDGKLRWTTELPADPSGGTNGQCSASDLFDVDGTTVVANVPGEGLRVLDAATGNETARIAVPELAHVQGCASLGVAAGRALLGIRQANDDGPPDALAAFDVGSRQRVWTAPMREPRVIWLDRSVLYASASDEVLRAVDLASGKVSARWGYAGLQGLFASDDQEPASVALCGNKQLIAFSAAASGEPEQTAIIEATVRCTGCKPAQRNLPGVIVRVGDVTTKLDKRGHFRVTVKGRGRLRLEFSLPPPADGAWDPYDLVVPLVGKKRYDLKTIKLRQRTWGEINCPDPKGC